MQSATGPHPPPAARTIPYPEDVLGPLRVFEETGQQALASSARRPGHPTAEPAIRSGSRASTNRRPGRHVLCSSRRPIRPGATRRRSTPTSGRSRAIADTATSRIVSQRCAARIPIPRGIAGVVTGIKGRFDTSPNLPGTGNALPINVTQCGPNFTTQSPLCVLPLADVNVRVGTRLYTTRATADGAWGLPISAGEGMESRDVLAGRIDSEVGGAWSESCPSNELDVGLQIRAARSSRRPDDITVDAVGPQGTVVNFDVTALDAAGRR
jgi:hypothetical protein